MNPIFLRFFLGGSVSVVVPVVVPVDLADGVQDFINNDSVINEALGSSLPDFPKRRIASSEPQDELPFVVITGIDGAAVYEGPNRGPVAPAEVMIHCFDYKRRDAVSLANLITSRITDAEIRWSGGSCASFKRINPFQGATQDPQKWRDGRRVHGVLARFRTLIGGSI